MISITVLVFYLYTRPWIRMEYVSLILLTTLLLMFYVFPYDGQTRPADGSRCLSRLRPSCTGRDLQPDDSRAAD